MIALIIQIFAMIFYGILAAANWLSSLSTTFGFLYETVREVDPLYGVRGAGLVYFLAFLIGAFVYSWLSKTSPRSIGRTKADFHRSAANSGLYAIILLILSFNQVVDLPENWLPGDKADWRDWLTILSLVGAYFFIGRTFGLQKAAR